MQAIELPRSIDDPPNVLLWTVDEIVRVTLGVIIGILADNLLFFTVVGAGVTSVYKRFRDGRPDGYLLHLIYWAGFLRCGARTIPNPYCREYLP